MTRLKHFLVHVVNIAIIISCFWATVQWMPWGKFFIENPPTDEEWKKLEEVAYDVVQTGNYNAAKLEIQKYDGIEVTEFKASLKGLSVEVKNGISYVKVKLSAQGREAESVEGKEKTVYDYNNIKYSRYLTRGGITLHYSSPMKIILSWAWCIFLTTMVAVMMTLVLMLIVWFAISSICDFIEEKQPIKKARCKLNQKWKRFKTKFIEWLKSRGEV